MLSLGGFIKLALLSDVHSNFQALEACLEHAQKESPSHYAFLGDLVGYGAQPQDVLKKVMEMAQAGAWVLKGNHDQMAVAPRAEDQSVGASTAAWTHDALSPEQRDFLSQLPMARALPDLFLVHASADEPERWRYVDSEAKALDCLNSAPADKSAQHIFVGHVHEQGLYYQGTGRGLMHFTPTAGVAVSAPQHRRWVATVGSVGQPRDGDPRAMYAIYDQNAQKIIFHRVSYDVATAAAAIRRAGLPEAFAHRLEVGR